jgi:hypothetical protein
MILPGNATLTVQFLPFVGLNTAVGFEVSIGPLEVVFSLGSLLASLLRFRFCNTSA